LLSGAAVFALPPSAQAEICHEPSTSVYTSTATEEASSRPDPIAAPGGQSTGGQTAQPAPRACRLPPQGAVITDRSTGPHQIGDSSDTDSTSSRPGGRGRPDTVRDDPGPASQAPGHSQAESHDRKSSGQRRLLGHQASVSKSIATHRSADSGEGVVHHEPISSGDQPPASDRDRQSPK
jgi:hypothetical protein